MTVDSLIDPGSTLGDLVAERPSRAQLFDQLRLDYCCGGRQTLAAACTKHDLELGEVLATLRALEERGLQAAGFEDRDWREVETAELCAHIVTVHHDGLRDSIPRIERLLATVIRVHGDSAPRLRDAERRFNEIRSELEPHLASEENELFPACIASDQTGTPVAELLIEQHESEHAAVGDALVALRALCGDYDRQTALCTTHRALLDALEAFEQDLHQHIHEENNILLQRVRQPRPRAKTDDRSPLADDRAATDPRSEALPPCCEGWIAEQAHGWAAHGTARRDAQAPTPGDDRVGGAPDAERDVRDGQLLSVELAEHPVLGVAPALGQRSPRARPGRPRS